MKELIGGLMGAVVGGAPTAPVSLMGAVVGGAPIAPVSLMGAVVRGAPIAPVSLMGAVVGGAPIAPVDLLYLFMKGPKAFEEEGKKGEASGSRLFFLTYVEVGRVITVLEGVVVVEVVVEEV